MHQPIITGSGVFTPEQSISNDELVAAFNAYADRWNADNAADIASGAASQMAHSSSEFILAASGIESRFVMDKAGILDPATMHPWLPERSMDEPSFMAEIGVDAFFGEKITITLK